MMKAVLEQQGAFEVLIQDSEGAFHYPVPREVQAEVAARVAVEVGMSVSMDHSDKRLSPIARSRTLLADYHTVERSNR